jgi:hypothetical protein
VLDGSSADSPGFGHQVQALLNAIEHLFSVLSTDTSVR